MHSDWFGTPGLSDLNNRQSSILIQQCSDLTFKLSSEFEILGIHCSTGFRTEAFVGWIGKSFHQIVSVESTRKLDRLFADNSASVLSEGRWRHLNFVADDGSNLPLLLKFFRFVNEGTAAHLVVARDLSPVVDAQRRFVKEQSVLEQELERQKRSLSEQPSESLDSSSLSMGAYRQTLISRNRRASHDTNREYLYPACFGRS